MPEVIEILVPGTQGPAGSLEIGTVESGETAEATITGPAGNQHLNLTLPQGEKGDHGDPIDAAGLIALLAAAEGDEALVLADELARMIQGALPALPALPLAAGAKVVGLGHSFIQRGGWGITAGGNPARSPLDKAIH